MIKHLFYSCLFLLLIQFNALSQQKVGHVSLEDVISLIPKTKQADSLFKQYRNALLQHISDKEKQLNAEYESLSKQNVNVSSEVVQIKRDDLNKRLQDFEQERSNVELQLANKQETLIAPIRNQAMDLIKEVAKENSYDFVIKNEMLITFPEADDLLPLIKKKIARR